MQNDFNTQDPSWLNTALQAEAQLKDLEEQEQEAQAAKPKPSVASNPEAATAIQLT